MSHDDEDSDSYKMSLRGIPLAMSMQSLNHGGKGYVGSDLFEASSLSKSYHRAAVANESSGVDTGNRVRDHGKNNNMGRACMRGRRKSNESALTGVSDDIFTIKYRPQAFCTLLRANNVGIAFS